MAAQTPGRAADFIASVGVCAHIEDAWSSYAGSSVGSQLAFLGIRDVRVEAPFARLSNYLALGLQGVRFDVISTNTNLGQQIGLLDVIAPYVTFAEGPNEINTSPVAYRGLSGASAAIAYQQDFYQAVHSDPLLGAVSVLPFSLSVGGNLAGFDDVSASADFGNVHGYAAGGVPPYYMLGYAVASVTTTPGRQAVMTETGNYTAMDGRSGVTELVQATWLIDSLLENWSSGVARTYLYQLEDNYSLPADDPENHWGLYTVDGRAKLAAVAIHNLTNILADTGSTADFFAPAVADIKVSGLHPDYGFKTVLAKSNGRYDVALWSEPQFYDAGTGKADSVTPSSVTLALGAVYDVSIYDPILSSAPVETRRGVTAIDLLLGTNPLVIELTPAFNAVPSTDTTLGAGPDRIKLGISEDAWQGDAQFTVQVDGRQIGSTQTAVAQHGLGESQSVTLQGRFGAGDHSVTVDFLNDAYDGTSDTDRNLYVDTITADGATVPVRAALLSSGSQSFTVTLPVLPAVFETSRLDESVTVSGTMTVHVNGDSPTVRVTSMGSAMITGEVAGLNLQVTSGSANLNVVQADGSRFSGSITGTQATAKLVNGVLQIGTARGSHGTELHLGLGVVTVLSAGRDVIWAGAGAASMVLSGEAEVHAGSGDLLIYGHGIPGNGARVYASGGTTMFKGDTGNISYFGGEASNIAMAGLSRMTFIGGTGRMTVLGGRDETIIGGLGGLTYDARGGSATILTIAGSNNTLVLGQATKVESWGSDAIQAGTGSNVIVVHGDATITGGGALLPGAGYGSVTVTGGSQPLHFIAGAGRATLTLGSGGGDVTFGSGMTTVHLAEQSAASIFRVGAGHGSGNDVITGFRAGVDTLSLQDGLTIQARIVLAGSTILTLTDSTKVQLTGATDAPLVFG